MDSKYGPLCDVMCSSPSECACSLIMAKIVEEQRQKALNDKEGNE